MEIREKRMDQNGIFIVIFKLLRRAIQCHAMQCAFYSALSSRSRVFSAAQLFCFRFRFLCVCIWMRPFSILLQQIDVVVVVVGAAVPIQMSFRASKWIRHFHAYKCVYCVLASQQTLCWLVAYVYSLGKTTEPMCHPLQEPILSNENNKENLLGFSLRNLAKMYPEFFPYLFTRLCLETSSFCLPLFVSLSSIPFA